MQATDITVDGGTLDAKVFRGATMNGTTSNSVEIHDGSATGRVLARLRGGGTICPVLTGLEVPVKSGTIYVAKPSGTTGVVVYHD